MTRLLAVMILVLAAALGRTAEAATWFAAAAGLDADGETDAAERAADLL